MSLQNALCFRPLIGLNLYLVLRSIVEDTGPEERQSKVKKTGLSLNKRKSVDDPKVEESSSLPDGNPQLESKGLLPCSLRIKFQIQVKID